MDIKKDVTITLTAQEIEKILKQYLKDTQGIDVSDVYFRISQEYDEGDWQGNYPPNDVFSGAQFTGTISSKKVEL